MKIRNVEFDFDVMRAADADRFQQAVNEMQATAAAVPKTSGLGDIIRANCAMIDSFLADLLGEDYDIRLHIDTDDLRQLQGLYYEFLDICTAVQKEIQAMRTVNTVAGVDVKARAAAAAKQAAQSLPAQVDDTFQLPQSPLVTAPSGRGPLGSAGPLASLSEGGGPQGRRESIPFSKMNRAQRRAYVKALAGRK